MKKWSGVILILALMLLTSFSLVACDSGVDITVKFIVDGVEYSTQTTKEGVVPKLPSDPAKEGFTFNAWYYDNGVWEKPMTAQSFLDLPLTEDMVVTVYAHFNDNEPEPQGMDFDSAVEAYNSRTTFYISFSATINGTTADNIEWYEDDDIIIVKAIAVIGEPSVIWFMDKTTNKSYIVDKENHRMIAEDTAMVNFVPQMQGTAVDDTVTIGSNTYPCKSYVIPGGSVKFVNDRDKLLSILFIDDAGTQVRTYTNITISDSIPTTSEIYGVSDYQVSNLVAYTVLSSSMSPTLVMGNTYYFEPVEASSLAVGDIILVNTIIGEQTVQIAHRIVSIQDNGGTLVFCLKGDNNAIADSEQYTAEDIIGKLVGESNGAPGGSGEPTPEPMTNITISSDNVNEFFDISIIPPMAGETTALVLVLPKAKFEKLLQDNISAESIIITVTVNIKQYLASDNSLSQETNKDITFSYNRTWLDNSIHMVSEYSQSVYIGENPMIVIGTDYQTGNLNFSNKYIYENSIVSVSVTGKTTFLCRENG